MTLKEILKDVSAKVSDVCVGIDRRPTGVEFHFWRIHRLKLFELSAVGIMKLDRHGRRSRISRHLSIANNRSQGEKKCLSQWLGSRNIRWLGCQHRFDLFNARDRHRSDSFAPADKT